MYNTQQNHHKHAKLLHKFQFHIRPKIHRNQVSHLQIRHKNIRLAKHTLKNSIGHKNLAGGVGLFPSWGVCSQACPVIFIGMCADNSRNSQPYILSVAYHLLHNIELFSTALAAISVCTHSEVLMSDLRPFIWLDFRRQSTWFSFDV